MRFAPALLILASACVLPAAYADTVYNQPYTPNAIFESDGGDIAYDNFTLTSAASITSVNWYGVVGANEAPPTSFTIDFYANDGGKPGALLESSVLGSSDPVDTGSLSHGAEILEYSSAITPFAAGAGTEYWISIVGSPNFGWVSGSDGDGRSYVSGGQNGPVYSDLAFTLNDTTVAATPEPSSLMLLGTGLAGVAGMVRRRLRARAARG